jgi:hypothetical protein
MKLRPCEDFAPAQSSNFYREVAILASIVKNQEKELAYT